MQEHQSKQDPTVIRFPHQGLAGIFRVDQGLDQYGFFLNWRVVRDFTIKGKTPEYLAEASPYYFGKIPPELEENRLVRGHLFCYSSQDISNQAPIGCIVARCELKTDFGLIAVKTLETTTLEFQIKQVVEYAPDAVDNDDLDLTVLSRLNK